MLAISTAVVSANAGTGTDASALLDGFRPAIAVVTGIAAIGLVVAFIGARIAVRAEPDPVVAPIALEAAQEPLPEREAA